MWCSKKNDIKQERLHGYFHYLLSVLFLSYLSVLLSGVMIFVHPADSRAQPSAQAASLLIGPLWGYERRGQYAKLIGQKWEEARVWLVRSGSRFGCIGWTFEEVAVKWTTALSPSAAERSFFLNRLWLNVDSVDFQRPLRGFQGVPSPTVSLEANPINPISNFVH